VQLSSGLLTLAQIKVHELQNHPPVSEELETSRAVEQSLLSQLAEERTASQTLREDLESDLRCARDSIHSLQVDNDRLKTSLQEKMAAMNTLRSEFHACQRKAAETLQTTQLVEDSLLAHVRDIETKCTL
jgi:predicted nuclease with TOPRIM domain